MEGFAVRGLMIALGLLKMFQIQVARLTTSEFKSCASDVSLVSCWMQNPKGPKYRYGG